jgi:lipoprotein-releasing system permease protein
LLLAWRYVLGARHDKNISSMIKVCFLGIVIGAFSLTLVTAIMNGFEKATHEKIQGIHAQLIMRSGKDTLDQEAVSSVLAQEFGHMVSFSPTSMHQAIIQAQDSDDVTNIVMLKAIDPEKEMQVTTLNSKILQSTGEYRTLANLVSENNIVIGKALAEQLGLHVGDTVNILFTRDEQARSHRITLQEQSARVAGIFATGIEEFDASLALVSFALFNQLFPDHGISQYSIKLGLGIDEALAIKALQKRFNLELISWKELYPALVSALKLEKIVMFLILALITLVASMNIISLLFMQITQKRGDIAILKSLGMADGAICALFLGMGMIIALAATILGIVLGTLGCYLLERYPLITLPDAYYVDHLPAVIDWHIIIIVFTVILSMSFFATWIPARRSKFINIAHVLRFEA